MCVWGGGGGEVGAGNRRICDDFWWVLTVLSNLMRVCSRKTKNKCRFLQYKMRAAQFSFSSGPKSIIEVFFSPFCFFSDMKAMYQIYFSMISVKGWIIKAIQRKQL